MMVVIDSAKCTGCALCVKDCFPQNLVMENKKARTINEVCFQCGHCVAICPENAVEISDYDMADVIEVSKQSFQPEELLMFMKSRRSIRQYEALPVQRELLLQVIEAGRYTATASNRQELTFIVIEEQLQEFRSLVLDNLLQQVHALLATGATPPYLKNLVNRMTGFEEESKINPETKDPLFFGAPSVILIAGDHSVDAGLAASNMELQACANGLGVLYSGFIARGADKDNIKELVGVPEGKEILVAMLVGYPSVEYKRSAPRRSADIIWS